MRAYAMGIVDYEDIVKFCAKVTIFADMSK